MNKKDIGQGAIGLAVALYFLAVPFGFYGNPVVALILYLAAFICIFVSFWTN